MNNTTEYMFKIGDRVKVKEMGLDGEKCLVGEIGTIKYFFDGEPSIGIEFSKSFRGGHNIMNHGRNGYCRFGRKREIELVNNDWDD